jgi:hypothetical protein
MKELFATEAKTKYHGVMMMVEQRVITDCRQKYQNV